MAIPGEDDFVDAATGLEALSYVWAVVFVMFLIFYAASVGA